MWLVSGFLLRVPRGENLLDLLRPLNLSAAAVAIVGLEKNLALTILAEKPLLQRFLDNGYTRNPLTALQPSNG